MAPSKIEMNTMHMLFIKIMKFYVVGKHVNVFLAFR